MHRARRSIATAALALGLPLVCGAGLLAGIPSALAQNAAPRHERDCKVLRTCNFTRNGQPRGCLSSYTCRTCKMVTVKCNIGGLTKCQEFVCSWGG